MKEYKETPKEMAAKMGQCDTAPLIRLEAENAAIMSIITKINRLDHKEAITDLFKIVRANESIMNDLRRRNNHKQFKNKENEKCKY